MHNGHVSVFKYEGNTCTVVGVYVDDLLDTGTKLSAKDNFFKDMACCPIKDLGVVNKFLEIRIKLEESKGYILDQQLTIKLLLKKFGLDSANGVRTPIGDECNLEDEDAQELLSTRSAKNDPSVTSFQSMATRQTHKPTVKDCKTAKRIMRYLKMSKDLKLHLGGDGWASKDMRIESWSDADFAADKYDRKFVSGCVLTMDGSVVFWSCKK
ncbi:unnamed protein product [Peronospora effusa]|nr:unnamed protein product [Peronospora effusa]